MPGAPDLKQSNPLKKLVADVVYEAVAKLDFAYTANVGHVDVRRVSDLRTEVTITRAVNSANFPPRHFTVQVIEHQ
jgi:hypothetical protein